MELKSSIYCTKKKIYSQKSTKQKMAAKLSSSHLFLITTENMNPVIICFQGEKIQKNCENLLHIADQVETMWTQQTRQEARLRIHQTKLPIVIVGVWGFFVDVIHLEFVTN